MVHHCFQDIGLLSAHFLRFGACCLRTSYYFGFGTGEGMRLVGRLGIFEDCWLSLHLEHARASHLTFRWYRCFLQRMLAWRRLHFFRLNWLSCRSMSPLHVLLELRVGYEPPATLSEGADQLAWCWLVISRVTTLTNAFVVEALSGHAQLLAAQFEHWRALWRLCCRRRC